MRIWSLQLLIFWVGGDVLSQSFLDGNVSRQNPVIDSLQMPSNLVWGSILMTTGHRVPKTVRLGFPVSNQSVIDLYEGVLSDCENLGYPFAVASLNPVTISGDSLHGALRVDCGPLIKWDSIAIISVDKMPIRLIAAVSGIKLQSPYSELRFQRVVSELENLPFLELTEQPQVVFYGEKATLWIPVKKKKANSANLLAALQPKEDGSGFFLVGEANFLLRNAANGGETFQIEWKSQGQNQQRSRLFFSLPYLLGSSFGIRGEMKTQRQDSTFNTFNPVLGTFRNFGSGTELNVAAAWHRTGFLFGEAKNIRTRGFITSFRHLDLDRESNPRKGIWMEGELQTSGKRTERVGEAESSVPSVFESRQIGYSADFRWFLPPTLRWTVLLALRSGGVFNREDEVFISEVERLGGLATIRGFDEESIFAKSYVIFTTEVRYLLDNQTNVHAFVDFAEVRSPFFRNGNHSQPYGVGVGFSLGTGAMRFTLDYAIGSVVGDPFLFRNNRLHIGFAGKF